MLIFVQQVFGVAWSIAGMQIPLGNGMYITPWQIILGTAVIAMVVRFLIKDGNKA